MVEQGLQIVGERAPPCIGRMVGVAVSSEVETDYVESFGNHRGEMVPPVRVGTATV